MKKSYVKYPYLKKEVTVIERDCGHKIVFAHKDGEMVNISTWVKTGSINENDDNNGISHFLEHLMFKGTRAHKAGYFDKTLEAKGAIVNAATWKDYTYYYVTLPKGENYKDLYLALELHADMMMDPIIPDEEIGAPFDLSDSNIKVKRERHVVIEEIRMRKDQPWTKLYNACNFNMYKKHPYKRDVIGTPEIISQISRETIMDYYKRFYNPENMTTIVVGDFNEDEVLKLIEKGFNFEGRESIKNTPKQIDNPTEKTIIVENTAQVNTGYLMFGWLLDKASEIRHTIIMDMISIILGDGSSSRLYQNLIEKNKEQIFNIVESEHYQFRDGNNFFIQANFDYTKKDLAIEQVKEQLTGLLTTKITDEELMKAKKKLKTRLACATETVSDIGETIGYYMTVCDNLSLIEEYLKDIETISIDELEETIKNYLNINKATISVLMPN